ncbi:MAG TPA: transglutaminase-like cysteine peptidase [Sphingobium sp.]|uniref:transglutaminase-like cysteine peptidase n=1 Tax=Sphingobium sp. TaxID=1912891 RepID=UPI002ED0497A
MALTAGLMVEAAAAEPGSRLPAGVVADPPRGFVDLCRRDRVLCLGGVSLSKDGAKGAEEGARPLVKQVDRSLGPSGEEKTAKSADKVKPPDRILNPRWSLVMRVNRSVNDRVWQVEDPLVSGVPEFWQRPTGKQPKGDCEDIAIEKRVQLLARGFPAEEMFYAVVYRAGLGLHTVLIVRLAAGDYVLDSATPYVRLWSDTHYSWLRQQSPTDPLQWSTVPGATVLKSMAAS